MQLFTPPLLPVPVFSSSVVLSVQLFWNNNEAVNYLIMPEVLFSTGRIVHRLTVHRFTHNLLIGHDGRGQIISSLMGLIYSLCQ